jgi:hypothetical protein
MAVVALLESDHFGFGLFVLRNTPNGSGSRSLSATIWVKNINFRVEEPSLSECLARGRRCRGDQRLVLGPSHLKIGHL